MKKLICYTMSAILFAGCAGTMPNPIDRYSPGDDAKSCESLKMELSQIDSEIAMKTKQKSAKDGMNFFCGVTGFLVIVPWFFMDLKNSQEVEIDALNARKKALLNIYADKGCEL